MMNVYCRTHNIPVLMNMHDVVRIPKNFRLELPLTLP